MGIFMGERSAPAIAFVVEGVEPSDGSRYLLQEFTNSTEAVAWMLRYCAKENAGGWDRIEVYDVRDPDHGELVNGWTRPE